MNVKATPKSSACHRRIDCRLCGSKTLTQVLKLAPTPPANALVTKEQLGESEERFPLDVFICDACSHVQLLDVVNPEVLFRNYVYVSGTSPVFVEHFRKLFEQIRGRFPVGQSDLVLEIGSNDGTLLRFFKDAGVRVLGIDPALKIAEQATNQGIPTLPEFFTAERARDLREKHGPAKVVLANNVFAHADDLSDIASGIKILLADDGVFVFEVSYLVDVVEKTLFDTIYHEHTAYHSVKPLITFFAQHGLDFFAAERVNSHGGSLRGFVQHAGGPHGQSPAARDSLRHLLDLETRMHIHSAAGFASFEKNIQQLGANLRRCLAELKQSGKTIAGYGAPAKATTLLHHFGIKASDLDYIVDDSPWKQGLYSPGHHIPIVSSDTLVKRQPDYLLVLAWNFAEPIIQKNKQFSEAGGHFIVPVPALRVI